MTIKIRPADESDVYWICTQLKKFSDFYNSKYPLYDDPDFAAKRVGELVDFHYARIAYQETKHPLVLKSLTTRLGFLCGLLTPHYLNPSINTLSEVFWWTDPDHRRKGISSLLMDDYIEFGKQNAQWITFTTFHKTGVDDSYFLDRGFKLQEKTYLIEV